MNRKKNRHFKGIRTHALFVITAVLYQLSYEDQYFWGRPICWFNVNMK